MHFTVLQPSLVPSALRIVHPYSSSSLTEFSRRERRDRIPQLKLTTNNDGFVYVEVVIADCAPFSFVKQLYSSLKRVIPADKSNVRHTTDDFVFSFAAVGHTRGMQKVQIWGTLRAIDWVAEAV